MNTERMQTKPEHPLGGSAQLIKPSGFSIIDTIIVCFIIGILAVALLLIYTNMKQKARDSQRMSDVQTLKAAVNQYYSEEAEFPGPDEVSSRLTAEKYITVIPVDPLDR